jgi:hypothetical protein
VPSEIPPHVANALQVDGLLGDGENFTCRVFTNTDGPLDFANREVASLQR